MCGCEHPTPTASQSSFRLYTMATSKRIVPDCTLHLNLKDVYARPVEGMFGAGMTLISDPSKLKDLTKAAESMVKAVRNAYPNRAEYKSPVGELGDGKQVIRVKVKAGQRPYNFMDEDGSLKKLDGVAAARENLDVASALVTLSAWDFAEKDMAGVSIRLVAADCTKWKPS